MDHKLITFLGRVREKGKITKTRDNEKIDA